MTLFPPQAFRSTEHTHRRGTRAQQPLPADVLPGTFFYVIEEGRTEMSDGTDWLTYAEVRFLNIVEYSFSANQLFPPGTNQVRFNAGFPYQAVTAIAFDNVSAEGQDLHIGLIRIPTGSLMYIQDKNDNTQFATFQTTDFPVDHISWVEFPVVHFAHGNSIGGGQLVIGQTTNGPTAITPLALNAPISQILTGGNTNNFSNALLGQTQILRLTGNAGPPSHLTGIFPDVLGLLLGRLIIIANVGGATIFIDAEDGASLPSARFAFSENLGSGESIMCFYDVDSNRWRKING